jgi:hypothetical protein
VKPELPDEFEWPPRTRQWWDVWVASPLTDDFTGTDWDFLLDTALIHADFWSGNTGVAGELRARLAKIGATADDRKRLGLTGPAGPSKGTPLDELKARRAARRPAAKGTGRAAK